MENIQETIDALNFTLNTSCGNLTDITINLIVDRIAELKELIKHPITPKNNP